MGEIVVLEEADEIYDWLVDHKYEIIRTIILTAEELGEYTILFDAQESLVGKLEDITVDGEMHEKVIRFSVMGIKRYARRFPDAPLTFWKYLVIHEHCHNDLKERFPETVDLERAYIRERLGNWFCFFEDAFINKNLVPKYLTAEEKEALAAFLPRAYDYNYNYLMEIIEKRKAQVTHEKADYILNAVFLAKVLGREEEALRRISKVYGERIIPLLRRFAELLEKAETGYEEMQEAAISAIPLFKELIELLEKEK